MQHATEPIDCAEPDGTMISTEVLIIGFGLAAIPLIRELERDGINYAVISDGESIWDKLEKHDRLDFDLVSSMHTSLYSFELVNRDAADRYLTSKDFYSFIRKYRSQYNFKVINDLVTLVENHPSHSVVRTQSGRTFAAKHLVISTAFKRRMNQLLNEFNYASARDKTIVFTAMGDSVNLMISKLVPYNNRIILVTNGFFLLDKLAFYDGISYTLDQLEYHNLGRLSRFNLMYRKTILYFYLPDIVMLLVQKLRKFPVFQFFYSKYPLAIRLIGLKVIKNLWRPQSPWPNGIVAIKYWPIDSYQKLFDDRSLMQSIKDGYLLNDIAFFIDKGLIELRRKRETIIDRKARTIRWKGEVLTYDQIVDADYEVPNLPEIVTESEGSLSRKYEYAYRDNFMGIVPKELKNVYFIGFTRPTTGGLNNITEMQCLFTHKMIIDEAFNRDIYRNIEERIRSYNKYYYLSDTRSPTDHLVFYGFYTDDIARLIKINPRLSCWWRIRALVMHFIFPNTAFKYRQSGPYKVDGVKEMVEQIYKNHRGFSVLISYLLMFALLQLTAYVAVVTAYYKQSISTLALPFLLIIVLLNPVMPLVAAYGFGCSLYLNIVLVFGLALTAWYQVPLFPIASMVTVFALTYVFRRLGWSRLPFNDLRNKKNPKYSEFFVRYCVAFREVFLQRFG
jgi:hypothetical protein